ncbi:MAG TPA: hypothetical protein VFI91_08435 [Longimicrobiaceae bacterium]|nr:hypothetical protein [Longimicrobiaceae bacterium]
MLYYYLLYFFLAVGAKLILALIMIYFLLPSDRRCNACDEETILVRINPAGRIGLKLLRGFVEWRWCPRCGWEGMGRATKNKEIHREGRTAEPVPR